MTLLDDDMEDDEEFSFDDYLMASRYGVWLLVGLFLPEPNQSARHVKHQLFFIRLFNLGKLSKILICVICSHVVDIQIISESCLFALV